MLTPSGPKKEEDLEEQDVSSTGAWDPERMLEKVMRGDGASEDSWVEEGLPKLVDEIMEDYDASGVIDHLEGRDLPSKRRIVGILEDLLTILFPGYVGDAEIVKSNTPYFLGGVLHSIYHRMVDEVDKSLKYICRRAEKCPEDVCQRRARLVVKELLESLPRIRDLLRGDIQAAYDGDPAAKSTDEVILSYPCVLAITTYRIAHELYTRDVPLVPRMMSEYAHSKTGIDIHPGAKIGKNFFIDHGTGVVIGETAEIGDRVKIYQSVTLGALSFPKNERGQLLKGRKRHPTVGNNVIIYSGATILGGETIVGDDAVVGGNVWLTSSIPPGTQVTIVPPDHHYQDVNSPKKKRGEKRSTNGGEA